MTDEEEFAARSQLKWTREGDAWILLYRRRRMGRVVPDKDHPTMWRSVKVDGILSDTANLCWSKDNVMAQAIREVAWNGRMECCKRPLKMPSKMGVSRSEIAAHAFECSVGSKGWLRSNSSPARYPTRVKRMAFGTAYRSRPGITFRGRNGHRPASGRLLRGPIGRHRGV